MELSFATAALRSICEKRQKASAALGKVAAIELAARIADLVACETASELIDLFPEDIVALNPRERAIRLRAGLELRFCSGHVKTPTSGAGTDWSRVTRIKIIGLETVDD
ncbi:hypothetical protein [Hyphomicrobium sp.]|uniref:hypothetical protein n=1 Tax=Hyphomicrobium sp. TaxID=82 RepID=UPI0025BD5FBF|nr:hypothetical protein [Hyphomicrobium sp.]